MTKLTPRLMAAAYDLLGQTQPFDEWNLPPSEEIRFVVGRTNTLRGHFIERVKGKYEIMLSRGSLSHTNSILMTMAHEMIHLFEATVGVASKGQHGAHFHAWARRISRIHGWDPKLF